MSDKLQHAVNDVLDILVETGTPKDAIEVILRAHIAMTRLCKDHVDIESMLVAYANAFRSGWSLV